MKNATKKRPVSKIDPALLEKVLGGAGASIPPVGAAAGTVLAQPKFGSFYHS